MTRFRKILVVGLAVAVALVAGWFLTRPSATPPAPAPVAAPADTTSLFTDPTTVTMTKVVPADVTWTLSNRVAVPVSPTAGPTKTSPEGIRSGFARTPSGALLAAANWAAADAQQFTAPGPRSAALIDQRMLPWPGYDQAKAAATDRAARPSHTPMTLQIAGYRFLAYDGTHATVLIAQRITTPTPAPVTGYGPWINLVWTDGDWWVVPAVDGHGEIGVPITWPLDDTWTPWTGVS